MPKVGKIIETVVGSGKVLSVDPLNMKYKMLNDNNEVVECEVNDCTK